MGAVKNLLMPDVRLLSGKNEIGKSVTGREGSYRLTQIDIHLEASSLVVSEWTLSANFTCNYSMQALFIFIQRTYFCNSFVLS